MKIHASNQSHVPSFEATSNKLKSNRANQRSKNETATSDQTSIEQGRIGNQTSLAHRANWVTKLLEI